MFQKVEKVNIGEEFEIPLCITARAKDVTSNLLPEKSKNVYKKAYQQFLKWCEEKGIKNVSSENVLLAHFSDILNPIKPHRSGRTIRKLNRIDLFIILWTSVNFQN